MTREIKTAAAALGIAIHDRLVIGRKAMRASDRSACCEVLIEYGPDQDDAAASAASAARRLSRSCSRLLPASAAAASNAVRASS